MEKYFLQNNTTGYLVQIFEKDYEGVSIEIHGKLSFEKGKAENILDTIRGTAIRLQLEASPTLTFDEFSEADEQKYTVIVYKEGQIKFKGFLKPDGVTQSFVRDLWYVDLDFIDGLGSLKNLSFVKNTGLIFTGKLSFYEVIESCLARTGVTMTINSNIDVHYLEYAGTNILKDTYVNSERFIKTDNNTIMNCEEVMNSILNLCSACITQQDGYWWIYRPNDIKNYTEFINNTLDTTFTQNLYEKVGSQIDNYYPHHCNGNQQIQTKGAISAYRINYKYGFRKRVLDNTTLHHDSFLNFDNWTKATDLEGVVLVNDPLDTMGLLMYAITGSTLNVSVLTSDGKPVLANSQLDLVVEFAVKPEYQALNITPTVLFLFRVERSDGYYANDAGQWVNTGYNLSKFIKGYGGIWSYETWTLKTDPIPNDCTVRVVILEANKFPNTMDYLVEIQSCQLINNFNYDGRIGEFHTVTRDVSPSSIIKENQEVYNGDSVGDIFEGAIYKADKTTLTTVWTRTGKLEEKFLLQISAEDDMRIMQKPTKSFTGDFYGYLPYLSIIEINNISGLFMFVEYIYDTESNITRGKLQQFFKDEVPGINYALTFDYGNTVKPTIRS